MDANFFKLKEWGRQVERLADGELLVLMDCDMLVLRDFSEVVAGVRDFALAERSCKYPFNGGLVVVRGTDKGRELMRAWLQSDEELHRDKDLHAGWRKRFAGMNQASLGRVLCERYGELDWRHGVEWVPESLNWCDQKAVDPKNPPHVAHLKGTFRSFIEGTKQPECSGRRWLMKEFLRAERALANGGLLAASILMADT